MAGETYEYEKTQPGRRRSYNVRDQWGRKWLAIVERETADPVTMIPCFTDALQTPLKYIVIPKDAPYTCEILYEPWIVELREASQKYRDRREEVTRALHGDAANLKLPPTREIMRIIGKPPIEVKRVLAAAAGDRKALGLKGTGKVTPRAPVKAQPEPEFAELEPEEPTAAAATAEEEE